MNLELEKSLIFFFLKVLYIFQHFAGFPIVGGMGDNPIKADTPSYGAPPHLKMKPPPIEE